MFHPHSKSNLSSNGRASEFRQGNIFFITDHNFHRVSCVQREMIALWPAGSLEGQQIYHGLPSTRVTELLDRPGDAFHSQIKGSSLGLSLLHNHCFALLSLRVHPLASGCSLIDDTVVQPSGDMSSACKGDQSNLYRHLCPMVHTFLCACTMCYDTCELCCSSLSALGSGTSLCVNCLCCLWEQKNGGGQRNIHGLLSRLHFALKIHFNLIRVNGFKRFFTFWWICQLTVWIFTRAVSSWKIELRLKS